MKKYLILVLFIWCTSNQSFSQSKIGFSIDVGRALPDGQLAKFADPGIQFGATIFFKTANLPYSLACGAHYSDLNTKLARESFQEYRFDPPIENTGFKPFTVFIGANYYITKSVYILPAITGNFEEDWIRIGIEPCLGAHIVKVIDVVNIDVLVRMNYMNFFGGEENEKLVRVFSLGIAIKL